MKRKSGKHTDGEVRLLIEGLDDGTATLAESAQGEELVGEAAEPQDDFVADTDLADDVEEAGAEVADSDVADGDVAEPVADDIPMAVVEGGEAERRSAWRVLTSEDFPQLSLREILGGDYLIGSFLRRNILFILMLVGLGILYITNRYAAQQEIIEYEQLRNELAEKKNYAQTQYAELTMCLRQSSIENRLKALGDSLLAAPKDPPFVIHR